jgi:hypothetical protein
MNVTAEQKKSEFFVRFVVLAAVSVKMKAFWDRVL